MNTLRTGMLLAALTAIFMAVGFMIGGEAGMLLALVVAAGMNVFAYWNSDKIVLRMYKAREVDRARAPGFYGIVQQLAENAGLPMPRVYIIENEQPNAFATGRNPENAAVAATTGLLKRLSSEEVAGVMAHELAHVRNRDTLTMTITATVAGAISMLAQFGLFFGGAGNRNNPLGIVGVILIAILAPMAAAGLARVMISLTTLKPGLARIMEPRAPRPNLRRAALRGLAEAGVPVGVLTAPLIPALNDEEMEALLETAAGAGAGSAGYVLLRLPLEIKALFEEWLEAHFPDRKARVLKLVRETRGGKLYETQWYTRQRGRGPYAELLERRFALACTRLGLNRGAWSLDTTQFRRPKLPSDQLELL